MKELFILAIDLFPVPTVTSGVSHGLEIGFFSSEYTIHYTEHDTLHFCKQRGILLESQEALHPY
jgi:hypothetical protein